ncbi:MAG: (deoxy)nucleoside triphosphate pyrophosphohydrolase [Clostridiales bacterium]|jgi:8-oxo-dGTP diphosphatase|nr:(deoxy)nucleoside triphosphate pyrophosphohydrolase [Clostridiales bacterium]
MITVIAAIIVQDGKVLIGRRAEGQALAGKWEFPGGKLEKGETPQECLRREIKEELNLDIEVGEFFGDNVYHYDTGPIRLVAYEASLLGGQFMMKAHSCVEWAKLCELEDYDFAPADSPFVEKLRGMCQK